MHVDGSDRLVSVFENITTRLAESQEPNRLYDVAVDIAMETTDAQACSLYLQEDVLDATREPTYIVMVSGAGFEELRRGVRYARGQGLTGRIWETSQSVKLDTPSAIQDSRHGWSGLYDENLQVLLPTWVSYSLIGVPLRVGNRTLGVLKVENKNPHPGACFSEDDRVMLQTIASTIVLAIENQRQSERSYSLMLSALRDVSKMLARPENTTFLMLCDSIVEKCVEVFNAESSSLYIEESPGAARSGTGQIVMVSGAGYENLRTGARYGRGQGLTGTICEKGSPVKYDTRQEVENPENGWQGVYNRQVSDARNDWECCSLIGVPLRIGDNTMGVLKVENKKPVRSSHFSLNELRSLEVLASNIALALDMHHRREMLFHKGERARELDHQVKAAAAHAIECIDHGRSCLLRYASVAGEEFRDGLDFLEVARNHMDKAVGYARGALDDDYAARRKITVSLEHVLTGVFKRWEKVITEKGIELVKKLPDEVVYTNVDVDQVLEAFGNLIGNAIEAVRREDKPRIWLQATIERQTTLDSAVVLLVDNGPGLTEAQRAEFDRRASISSSKDGGHGMGIDIAKGLLADNGIMLEPTEPPSDMTTSGAAFRMPFKLCEPHQMKTLIIDDDTEWTKQMSLVCRHHRNVSITAWNNYQIMQQAADGSESAQQSLAEYDLVLLDCSFAGLPLDGPRLLSRLQTRCPGLAERVVLVSSVPEFQALRDIVVEDKSRVFREAPDFLQELRRRRR